MIKLKSNNAIYESLQNKRVVKLYVDDSFNNKKILELANQNGVVIEKLNRNDLTRRFGYGSQGAVAEAIPFKTYNLDNIIKCSKEVKNALVVMLDELNDPHNLGAILRSADVFGVTAVIYKNRNEVSLNDTVATVSAGAINYVKCCEVTNLNQTIEVLKKNGFWVVGLAGEATSDLKSIPKDVPLVVVVGSEGYGISKLVRKNCDYIVKIPMSGHVSCLNASVSCAIVLYELSTRK